MKMLDAREWLEQKVENKSYFDLYEARYQITTAIFNYRKQNKLTQSEMAKRLNVTQAMISKLEGGVHNFTLQQIWKLADKLGYVAKLEFMKKSEVVDSLAVCYQGPILKALRPSA